jgi:hypothetical protein
MKKKYILILIAVFAVIVSLIFVFKTQAQKFGKTEGSTIEVTHIKPEVGKLPFFSLVPRKDGNAFSLFVRRMGQNESQEYEITYQTAEKTEQGIIGKIEQGSEYYEKEHLFGTCSTKVCRYDKGVEFGKFSTTISSPENEYQLNFDFHLQKLSLSGGVLTQKDGSASLSISASSIPDSLFFISHPTGGIPVSVKEKIIAGPFGFFSSEFKMSKDATLSINLPKEAPKENLTIWGWEKDDKRWIEYSTEIKDQIASAKVNLFTTYIVVEKQTL